MIDAYEDPDHKGNSSKYHTGKPCIVPGCNKPAGTHWGPPWCFEHNVHRIKRIARDLENINRTFGPTSASTHPPNPPESSPE